MSPEKIQAVHKPVIGRIISGCNLLYLCCSYQVSATHVGNCKYSLNFSKIVICGVLILQFIATIGNSIAEPVFYAIAWD